MEPYWQGKSVLVTGAGGFISSHLVESLVNAGAQVRAFVRYNSRGDPGLLNFIDPKILDEVEIIAGDLRQISTLLPAAECDAVFTNPPYRRVGSGRSQTP